MADTDTLNTLLTTHAESFLRSRRFDLDDPDVHPDGDGEYLLAYEGSHNAYARRFTTVEAAEQFIAGDIADGIVEPGDVTVVDLTNGTMRTPMVMVRLEVDGGPFDF